MVKSGSGILRDSGIIFVLVTLKCGQSHINIVKAIHFCQLCDNKTLDRLRSDIFNYVFIQFI